MARFYPWNTTPKCTVHQVGQPEPIGDVVAVDTDTAQITVVPRPFKIEDDKVATEIKQFGAIHPIYAGDYFPCMFLCFD